MRVIWTPEAEASHEENLDYLSHFWSNNVMQRYFDALTFTINTIAQHPESFPIHDSSKGIHKAVILEQLTLFYRVKRDTVFILSLWDNRQDPDKLEI